MAGPAMALAAVLLMALTSAAEQSGPKMEVLLVSPPYSMLENMLRLASELQARGHSVTLGSTDKAAKKVPKAGVPFLSLGAHALSPEEELEIMDRVSNASHPLAPLYLAKRLFDGTDEVLHSGLQRFAADVATGKGRMPDMLVCTPPSRSCPEFAKAHNLKSVWSLPLFGLINPLFSQMPYIPAMATGLPYGRMAWWQRLLNLVPLFVVKAVLPIVGWPSEAFRSTVENSAGHLVLVPGVPGLDYPQHTPPLVQYTGAYLTAKDADPSLLPADLRAWLDEPGPPVLYISMGTVVQLPQHLCETFLEAAMAGAAAGEFRSLWALPVRQQGCLGELANQKGRSGLWVEPWVVTPAALAHPKVRAFLSHCGANGACESVWAQVPVLGLPFFGDQPDNCYRLRDLDLGVTLDRKTLTSADIRQGVKQLLSEPRFNAALRRIGHVMRAYGGVQRAADLIELVHQVGGDVSFLETPVATQGIAKALCLDLALVAAMLLAGVCFFCGRRSVRSRSAGRPKKD